MKSDEIGLVFVEEVRLGCERGRGLSSVLVVDKR